MKDLKDQLKDWKKAHPPADPKPPTSKGKTIARPPAPAKTDDELFREAVAGVERDAALKKFDATPPPPTAQKPTVEEDAALFERLVGDVEKRRHRRKTR